MTRDSGTAPPHAHDAVTAAVVSQTRLHFLKADFISRCLPMVFDLGALGADAAKDVSWTCSLRWLSVLQQ